MKCEHLLPVEKMLVHPGGTALRIEVLEAADRCALKPKRDRFGRYFNPVRWVLSGGSPIDAAHPCSGNCPLRQTRYAR